MGRNLVVQMFLVISISLLIFRSSSSAAATTNKICGVGLDEFLQCLPAVEGSPPPAPTKGCCGVIRKANLPCLCKYKSKIRDMGIDPVAVLALPKKCRIKLPHKC
ncbi:putative lipid-transfer protein DIR1 [Impatiens glandulifera]|uniref:putative lipid-transfer protein DIR1 n=1 Tax=Impatiens glandulifera TaxID=253017 RepID=UPI001FB17BE3|nr:putative lipid-transfer protein DIR1 [Impatiens glandulifera]